MEKKAVLLLSDGTVLHGRGLGALGSKSGELVFNTSMTGYQEALTDPSYAGQILVMTYPLVGNYGFSPDYTESQSVHVEGFVVKWAEFLPHHHKSIFNLDQYLESQNTGALFDIDTRMLVRKIRSGGVMPAAYQVYPAGAEPDLAALKKLLDSTVYSAINFVPKVSIKQPRIASSDGPKHVVLIDYGVKESIVRELNARGVNVTVVPHDTDAKAVLALKPDGIFLSNGPGDPAILKKEVAQIKALLGRKPLMGVCLGQQLLAHATGGQTFKLKFGHRGANHPVLDKQLNRVFITTQNHGYAVDEASLSSDWEITHVNLNDGSIEGMENRALNAFCVQYHPEAHPGPRDSLYLFDKFVKML